MTTTALLGTGLLGSGMVENLLQKGHSMRVWNRTAAKAAPLAQKGAVLAADPAACVRSASRVHLVLQADDAVDAVIEQLRPGLGKDVFVFDHSTNLPARVAERTPRLRASGVRYVHAPVFMSPKNAREASGMMLVAASAKEFAEIEPMLAPMTGKLMHTGERADLAAFHKISGNGLLIGLMGLMGDLLAMGRALGISADEVLKLYEAWNPAASLAYFGKTVEGAGTKPATFELQMARKDVGLMVETGRAQGLSVLPAVAAAMDRAIQKGAAQKDWAVYTRADRV